MFSRPRVIRSDVEGRRDRHRERAYQRRYARRHGYFWLPCQLCGDEYGGHEAGGSLPTDEPGRFSGICPACTKERQELAEQHLRELGRAVTGSTTRWGFDQCLEHRVGTRPHGHATNGLIVRV